MRSNNRVKNLNIYCDEHFYLVYFPPFFLSAITTIVNITNTKSAGVFIDEVKFRAHFSSFYCFIALNAIKLIHTVYLLDLKKEKKKYTHTTTKNVRFYIQDHSFLVEHVVNMYFDSFFTIKQMKWHDVFAFRYLPSPPLIFLLLCYNLKM